MQICVCLLVDTVELLVRFIMLLADYILMCFGFLIAVRYEACVFILLINVVLFPLQCGRCYYVLVFISISCFHLKSHVCVPLKAYTLKDTSPFFSPFLTLHYSTFYSVLYQLVLTIFRFAKCQNDKLSVNVKVYTHILKSKVMTMFNSNIGNKHMTSSQGYNTMI